MAKRQQKAHIRDGVWICGFSEYQILITALRNSLIEISKVVATEEAREEKAQVMDFLTSQEFAGTIEQMIRPIVRMQEQLEKRKSSHWRLSERENSFNLPYLAQKACILKYKELLK